jgi:hypothetical protein
MPYPPGTSAGDPRAPWNAPDRSHEHEWESREANINPVIEDGAAIFTDECRYAEGQYGDGWQCEETRTYRFEYSELEWPDGEKQYVYEISEWESNTTAVQAKVIQIEEEFLNGGDATIDVDPDPECGSVIIEWRGAKLRYEP